MGPGVEEMVGGRRSKGNSHMLHAGRCPTRPIPSSTRFTLDPPPLQIMLDLVRLPCARSRDSPFEPGSKIAHDLGCALQGRNRGGCRRSIHFDKALCGCKAQRGLRSSQESLFCKVLLLSGFLLAETSCMRLRRLRRLQSTRIDLERRSRKTEGPAVCAQPNAHQRAVQVNEGGDEGIIPNGQRGQSTEDLPALRLNRLVGGMLSVEELRVGVKGHASIFAEDG